MPKWLKVLLITIAVLEIIGLGVFLKSVSPSPAFTEESETTDNFDAPYVKVVGEMYIAGGKTFVDFGDHRFFRWERELAGIDEPRIPTPLKVTFKTPLKDWAAQACVQFPCPPGSKCLAVEISAAGIGTPSDAKFLAAMEKKTRHRHPDIDDENELLANWLTDESYRAFGAGDKSQLAYQPISVVHKRLGDHFEALLEKWGLSDCVHMWITTHVDYFDPI